MKLWGGAGDSGCCSVGDVEDARRVASRLGIEHHVFNFSEEFEEAVVAPYAAAHAAGRTPNPCIECNRHLKFRRFLDRAVRLGFDAVATGHHARVAGNAPGGPPRLLRGRDRPRTSLMCCRCSRSTSWPGCSCPSASSPSHKCGPTPAGLGLPTATKPDSQEVCFVAAGHGPGSSPPVPGRADRAAPGAPRGAGDRSGRRHGQRGGARDRRPAPRARHLGPGTPLRARGRRGHGDGHGRHGGRPAHRRGRAHGADLGRRASPRGRSGARPVECPRPRRGR